MHTRSLADLKREFPDVKGCSRILTGVTSAGDRSMKHVREFIVASLLGGLLIVVPIYFSVLLVLKAMKAVGSLVRPIAQLLTEWLSAETLLSLVLVLIICFFVGAAVRTTAGRAIPEQRNPSLNGSQVMHSRSLTQ
jgi:hypothetical protein